MIYGLGPRARRVYAIVRDRIARGDWAPGMRLPSHRELATELGVAPLTVRQVLAQLEAEGLVSREVGRGTFVREAHGPTVLLVGADQTLTAFLTEYVARAGLRSRAAPGAEEARAILSVDRSVVLALCELWMPTVADGSAAVRLLRARWPALPVVALATELGDLAELFGTPAWPLAVMPKPVNLGLLDDLLRLVSGRTITSD
jgi:DNA-binding transcriptional regulator YhcF (GntR family)